MRQPPALDLQIRHRLDELISELESLLNGQRPFREADYFTHEEWIVKVRALLTKLFTESKEGDHFREVMERRYQPVFELMVDDGPYTQLSPLILKMKVSTLKGIRNNYLNGFYDSIEKHIIAEVSADYMEQAEALLGEGIKGQFDHVPAAVLCGAVLENRLRSFCEQQEPPIKVTKRDGSSKTLGPLIGELEKRKRFNKLVFKNLKSWAEIRNLAAHGKYHDFTRHDVELMLSGVQQFLALHL